MSTWKEALDAVIILSTGFDQGPFLARPLHTYQLLPRSREAVGPFCLELHDTHQHLLAC